MKCVALTVPAEEGRPLPRKTLGRQKAQAGPKLQVRASSNEVTLKFIVTVGNILKPAFSQDLEDCRAAPVGAPSFAVLEACQRKILSKPKKELHWKVQVRIFVGPRRKQRTRN